MHEDLIAQYTDTPALLRQAVAGLSPQQLRAFPVPGTWSIQQIVIHLLDSELVGIDRMKRVIAEDLPLLIGYDESKFARNLFYDEQDTAQAIDVLQGSFALMGTILRRLPEQAWQRAGIHNEIGRVTLAELLHKYVKHQRHHLQFIEKKRAMVQAG